MYIYTLHFYVYEYMDICVYIYIYIYLCIYIYTHIYVYLFITVAFAKVPGPESLRGAEGRLICLSVYCCSFCLRRLRDEQVPTRSPIALAQFQTIHN